MPQMFPYTRALFVSLAALSAVATSKCTEFPLPVTVLHTFDQVSWLENLAIRSTGEILTSRLDTPALYQVNHVTGSAVEIATWDASEFKGALGISETATDVFYVILSAFVGEDFVKTGGVNSIFKVDMSTFQLSDDGTSVEENATVSLLTEIGEADFLNGMATLDDGHIYVSDVYSGVVYLVDTATGDYQVAVDDMLMKYSLDGSAALTNLGSNGLKVHNGYLYWANTANGFVARKAIRSDGQPMGQAAEIVATNVAKADDFQISSDGTLWVAQNQQDTLSFAAAYRGSSVAGWALAGSNTSTTLAGVTSPKFGRTAKDSKRLYLSTSGGKCRCSVCCCSRLLTMAFPNRAGESHQRDGDGAGDHLLCRHSLFVLSRWMFVGIFWGYQIIHSDWCITA